MGFVSFRVIAVTELSKPSKAVQTKRTDEHSRQKNWMMLQEAATEW